MNVHKVPQATKVRLQEIVTTLQALPHEANQLNKTQHQNLLIEFYSLADPPTVLSLLMELDGYELPDMPLFAKKKPSLKEDLI